MLVTANSRIFTPKIDTNGNLGTYVHKRVLSEHSDTRQRHRLKGSQRASARLKTRQRLQDLAATIGEHTLADRYGKCHSKLAVLTCGEHVAKVIPNYACQNRLCPDCGRRRAAKFMRTYLPAVVAFPKVSNTTPVLITLTQAHRKETLQQAVKRLTSNFKKLRKRAFWNYHFKGGLFTVEFTIDAGGLYHAHLHVLGFRTRFFDVQVLKDLWLEVTGDSHVVNIKRIDPDNIVGGLKEVLKYAVKPASIDDFTPDHLRDFLAMKRQRMFTAFGEFQAFARDYSPQAEDTPPLPTGFSDAAEGTPCPHCSEPLFEVRVKGSELPDFLRRVELSAVSRGS